MRRSPIGRLLDFVIIGYKHLLTLSFYSFDLLLSTVISRGETLFHVPLITFLELNSCSKNILKQFQNLSSPNFFIAPSKIIKDFFARGIVLAAATANISSNQQPPAATSSNQQQPAATSSNQQYPSDNQQSSGNQQQPAATSSHQQQPVATSSNQQYPSCNQQSAGNQQQPEATSNHPSTSSKQQQPAIIQQPAAARSNQQKLAANSCNQ